MKISKLLVANRGEIAIRIFRAGTELGLRTVAIYSYEDRYSLHRYKADEAYQIGEPDEPLKSYLSIEEIIDLAKRKGVDAIHPGYGFLSESVELVRRCEEEGIIFVGPKSQVMEQLGDKADAKKIARTVGVPVIEDSDTFTEDLKFATSEAKRIGFPIMVKAVAGGGGRGMRVVRDVQELKVAIDEAHREALRAFGDGTLFLEKFIDDPKHIEVQILGDNGGKIVHLFERDCSIQRRFQKVVEIAPCPAIDPKVRDNLYEYATKIAKHVGYNNAGTVEFLVDGSGEIFFIEVNPRIQVEHTVTEEVTGVDLVRSQILVAGGVELADARIGIDSQESLTCNGFAIQCRITTEDPLQDFTPDYGRIAVYRSPGGFGIRLDAGSAYGGAVISPFFDSLLVKITAHGRNLDGASQRLVRALKEFRIRGVKTNIPFLQRVVSHPELITGRATVSFIADHPEIMNFPLPRDRATKILNYIGDVIVNGNPDVTGRDLPARFRTPTVPAFEKLASYPDGTKQRLEKLGRDQFVSWLRDEKAIQYTDTTLRDAHQSLLATRVRTYDMLKVAESFAKSHPETFSMEVWGGATFDVAMRFLHECPWQRLKLLREAVPNILLQMLLRGSNGVGYTAYPDNLIESFIEYSWKSGIDIFRIFDSMNWLDAMEVSIKTVLERTEALAEVCICYTGDILDPSRTKYTLDYYLDLAKRVEDTGAHILAIKDMAGLLKPKAARVLVEKLRETVDIPIHLHTHDTSSIQAATCLEAVRSGVDVVDVALASMSGLTSQPNFNSVAAMLKGHERELEIDTESLEEFSSYWEVVREYYAPFESGLKAGTGDVYRHEIPGGQYSNLYSQARALGLEDRFEKTKDNYVIVNELLGDLVKVTPSSKVVGDLALMMTSNDITKEDLLNPDSGVSYPASLRGFLRGDLGQPHGGFPSELQKIVLKGDKPITGRPNNHLDPINFDAEFKEFLEEFGGESSFLDFLSYKLYPKVFKDYAAMRSSYGRIRSIPTPVFLFGLEPGEECMVEIDQGKTLIIRFVYVSEPDEKGIRSVNFRLNGQSRVVEVKDRSIESAVTANRKATAPNEVGSPLQGKLSKVLVKAGDKIKKSQELFVIEAMKMETTVPSPADGTVVKVHLSDGAMVEASDLIVELSD